MGARVRALLKDFRVHRTLWLMMLPAILFFIVFSYLPMLGAYFAFTKYEFRMGYFRSPFIGLGNFAYLFKSGILWQLTVKTLLYNLAFLLFGNVAQILCALFLNDLGSRRFVRISQTILFLPYFISMVLVGVFAYNLLNIDNGFINSLLSRLGMKKFNFYMTPSAWPFLIVAFHVWKGLGYGTVVYLSALTSLDPELYEAARMDGATKWQQLGSITLPLLKPTAILLMLFSLGSIMKGNFELFYQLIGKNGTLYEATDIIDTYVYRALMVNYDIGMSSAAGLYQSVFGFLLVVTVNGLVKKYEASYALF